METAMAAVNAATPTRLLETAETLPTNSRTAETMPLARASYEILMLALIDVIDTRFYVGECYVDWYCNGAYPVKDGRDIKNVFTVGVWQKAGNGNCKACGE